MGCLGLFRFSFMFLGDVLFVTNFEGNQQSNTHLADIVK